jgi:hypothetical protein
MEKRELRKYSLTLTYGMLFVVSLVLTCLPFIRIAAVPLFLGLCRFPEGCSFKQWTGDDSKALMKVCPCL